MKNKIFEKMREYGWNLGDNTNEDFEDIYKIHYNFTQNLYDYFVETDDVNIKRNLNDINEQKMYDMISFMSDFLRALNELDIEERIKEIEKKLEYCKKRDEVCCSFGTDDEIYELKKELENLKNELERV